MNVIRTIATTVIASAIATVLNVGAQLPVMAQNYDCHLSPTSPNTSVPLRAVASTTGRIIASIPRGITLTVIRSNEAGWIYVRTASHQGWLAPRTCTFIGGNPSGFRG